MDVGRRRESSDRRCDALIHLDALRLWNPLTWPWHFGLALIYSLWDLADAIRERTDLERAIRP